MNIQNYTRQINEIVSTNNQLFETQQQPDFDLINLTKPLTRISQLNKKYSLVDFDKEFIGTLTESERKDFLYNMASMNNLLMNFFATYHSKNNI